MAPKDDKEMWEYYKYPENYYNVLNPDSLTADEKDENFNLVPFPLRPHGLTSLCQ